MDDQNPPEEVVSNVVEFPRIAPFTDIQVERVLKGALEKNLQHIVVIGRSDDGQWYHASSSAHIPSVLWMLECAKSDLLRM